MTGKLSFGVAGALDAEVVRRLAPRLEAAGFRSLWVNDTPTGDSLASLAVAAEVTERIGLATGVIALDRRDPAGILADVERLGLPAERLVLGVGSGQQREGVLELVRGGVAELKAGTAARIVVGALGPRMRALALETDGVLLNWCPPAAAAEVADGAPATASVILYVRTIAEEAARDRLAVEAARYGSAPQYAANFARLGIEPIDTAVDLAAEPGALAAFADAVDELVIRAITPTDSFDEYLRFLEAPGVRALLRG